MKKTNLFAGIAISLFVFVSSSVWEGAAAASVDLPQTGHYIATNSFPIHTVVNVTNLENGRTLPLVVTSGIESSGFLALLSKDAADALGLHGQAAGRIRMSQSSDPSALSLLAGFGEIPEKQENNTPGNERMEGGDLIVDLPDYLPDNHLVFIDLPDTLHGSVLNIITEKPVMDDTLFVDISDAELTMVPAETRPPEGELLLPDPDQFVAEISPAPEEFLEGSIEKHTEEYQLPDTADYLSYADTLPSETMPVETIDTTQTIETSQTIDTTQLIDPVRPYVPASTILSAPIIDHLEKGMYYLQVGAYSFVENVETAISSIDNNLPVAVMRIGSFEKPVYRVLIGPVNLGESGALLQRYRGKYHDAFVRLGI